MSPVTPPSELMREERLLCYFTFVMMICVFLSLCLSLSGTCNDGSVRWRTSTPDDQRYLWEKFKADHACRLIESRDRDNNGPARDAWICDDGAVYWKNRLPG